jgi:hypothetical protein
MHINPGTETFRLARKWLHESENNIKNPPMVVDSPSSRLLKISGDIVPKLCLIKPKRYEKYAALSYCWGDPKEEKGLNYYSATLDTVERGFSAISFTELPPTIQDAVTVTQNLGLQYLWVDRLCILQDDDKDLEKELGKMPSIYGSAHVTISAASAAKSTAGFLRARYDSTVELETIKLNVHAYTKRPEFEDEWQGEKDVGPIYLRPIKSGKDMTSDLAEHIESRAWTMQEHLLSQKLLFFGSRQLRWVCGTAQYTDGGRDDEHMLLPFPFLEVNKESPFHTAPAVHPDRLSSRYSWDALILEFSKRQLSRPADKLKALGGLAYRFAELMGYSPDDYLAGVWRPNLTTQLLWAPHRSDIVKRQTGYRAPSWSWASIDGRIDSTGFQLGKWQFHFSDHYTVRPSLVDVKCEPVSALNSFGAVKSGHLKCQGRIRQVELIEREGEYFLKSEGSKALAHAYFDTKWEVDEIQEAMRYAFCLVIASARPYKYAGLIIVPQGDSDFRREGIWKFDANPLQLSEKRFEKERKKWLDGCQVSTVLIK